MNDKTDIYFKDYEHPEPTTPADKLEHAFKTGRSDKQKVQAIIELIRFEIDAAQKRTP